MGLHSKIQTTCANCGAELYKDGSGFWRDADGNATCPHVPDYGTHRPR